MHRNIGWNGPGNINDGMDGMKGNKVGRDIGQETMVERKGIWLGWIGSNG